MDLEKTLMNCSLQVRTIDITYYSHFYTQYYCSRKCCISLFFSDVDDGVDVYGLIPVALSHDHCDVLLDAMDAQLSHLQVKHL